MSNTPKHEVTIKTYKIKAVRDAKGKINDGVTLDLTEDMLVSSEDHEFDGSIALQLGSLAKKIADYNHRQIKMANLDPKQETYKRRIIGK